MEAVTNEQVTSSVRGIANLAERNIIDYHNLDRSTLTPAGNSLFVGIDSGQMVQALEGMGIEVEGGLGPACTFSLPTESTTDLEQVIWVDSTHDFIKPLSTYTDSGFESNRQGLLIVAEEVSHFVYKSSYFRKYKAEPEEWMVEMIGALDKYNLLQSMYMQKYGRQMLPLEEIQARQMIFTANQPQLRRHAPSDHVVGHTRAELLVNKLNEVARTKNPQVAKNMFNGIYGSDQRTVLSLLASLGIN